MDMIYFYIGLLCYVHYYEKLQTIDPNKFNMFTRMVLCTIVWPIFLILDVARFLLNRKGYQSDNKDEV